MKRPTPIATLRNPTGPTFATEALKLRSFAFLARAIEFWTHRIRGVACPTCGVIGALVVDIRGYGARFTCDNCKFEHLEVSEDGVTKRRHPEENE